MRSAPRNRLRVITVSTAHADGTAVRREAIMNATEPAPRAATVLGLRMSSVQDTDPRSTAIRRGAIAGRRSPCRLAAAVARHHAAGVPLRDPGGVTLRPRCSIAVVLAVVLARLDVVVRAARRYHRPPAVAARPCAAVRRERWTAGRGLPIAGRDPRLLRHLLRVPQRQERRPAVRPGELHYRRLARLRPQPVLRQRPRRRAALAARHRRLGARAVGDLPAVLRSSCRSRSRSPWSARRAPSPGCSSPPRCRSTGCSRRSATSAAALARAVYADPRSFADLPVTGVSQAAGHADR